MHGTVETVEPRVTEESDGSTLRPDAARLASRRLCLKTAIALCGAAIISVFGITTANAIDYSGTVDYTGQATFDVPIPGIAVEDLTISVGPETEATGSGVKCSVLSSTADSPDVGGIYPDAGMVSADMLVERGGPNIPDGDCIVTIIATGSDGVSTSARGIQTVFVPVGDVDTSATVAVADITVRQSKAIAGITKECGKWFKKQSKFRAKCNDLLLKKGPDFAAKCKVADPPEPVGCDDGARVAALLQLAYDANDQQLDPFNAEGVDRVLLKDNLKCQKMLGKAVVGYVTKYVKLIDKKCVQAGIDDNGCRQTQAGISKKKLDKVDKCVVDQAVDGMTGRTVAVVGAPCDVCFTAGVIDRKCMKSCFQIELTELGDGFVGDVPECGNGIVQQGEFCDDGNVLNGDCCSSICGVEAGDPEGPLGDPTCTDLVDNDCDTAIDAADTDCQ